MRTRARVWIPGLVPGLVSGLVSGLMSGLVLASTLIGAGCGEDSKKSGAMKSQRSWGRAIPEKVGVKLLTTGSGPKAPLRYRFRAPETHRVKVTLSMSVGVSTEKRSVPVQQMPDMEMHLSLKHREVSADGTLKYTFELTRAGLVGGGSGAMEQRFSKVLGSALRQLAGLTGSGEATARGVARLAVLKLPDAIPGPARKAVQSLQEQIQELSVPLPAAAVGAGARWEVEKPLPRAALRMGQVATYTLEKRQGTQVTLDLRLEQFAPAQELRSEQLPRGAKAMLHSLKSTGSGRFHIDLTRPVPRGELRYQTRIDQTVSARAKSQRMQLDLGVHARFAPE